MNDLAVLEKIAQSQKLKVLVLDSVSSPITKRVYNMALEESYAWVSAGAATELYQGDRERVAGVAGRTLPRVVVDNHSDVSDPQGGSGGRRQWAAGVRTR